MKPDQEEIEEGIIKTDWIAEDVQEKYDDPFKGQIVLLSTDPSNQSVKTSDLAELVYQSSSKEQNDSPDYDKDDKDHECPNKMGDCDEEDEECKSE